ncbi:hypothetical protein FA13DRAFT_1720310 [Coprinellus micaceus]|uniref:Uncharacterized protein n=1 Tax=Coprinellus micaceus TaxID=71717 RepID=A0A4Y7S9L8_COPMI|nr:hypothetical protein FA13DRAFT_1720310 [Coprinellus micaceus]
MPFCAVSSTFDYRQSRIFEEAEPDMGNARSGGGNLESSEDSHQKSFEEEVGSLPPTDSSAVCHTTAVSRLMQSRNMLEDPACLNPSSAFVPLRKCSQPCLRIRLGADLLTTRTAARHPVGLRHRTIAAEETAQEVFHAKEPYGSTSNGGFSDDVTVMDTVYDLSRAGKSAKINSPWGEHKGC